MDPSRVLVAFSSRSGSTAGTAELIASVLRSTGLPVDCRPAGEVADLAGYRAVVLGSGVFVRRRASDGGGFLARHALALRSLPVWLFCDGPIGGGGERGDGPFVSPGPAECPAATVARAIGARGVATFGTFGMPDGEDPVASLFPADAGEVRAWAGTIAAALDGAAMPGHRPPHRRRHGHGVAVGR
jgi:menaquinone-dependent protoporphyrinogen oxidase